MKLPSQMILDCIKLRANLRFPDEQFQQTYLAGFLIHTRLCRGAQICSYQLLEGLLPSASQMEDSLAQAEPSICFQWEFSKVTKCLLCRGLCRVIGWHHGGFQKETCIGELCVCPIQLRIAYFVIRSCGLPCLTGQSMSRMGLVRWRDPVCHALIFIVPVQCAQSHRPASLKDGL